MMVPLIVTAEMGTGVAHTHPWGISLDGILAAELWARHKHTHPNLTPALDADDPPDLDLPLARCTPPDGLWHWAATCAWPDPPPDHPEIHLWTGRLDHRSVEQLTCGLPRVVSDRQGRHRARCMPLMVTVCATLTWHAVGDPDAVRDLVASVPAIGKKRSQGEGRVLSWRVVEAPDMDVFTAAHLYPDGTLGRPTPAGCLTGHVIVDGGQGLVGVRPPSMHHSRMAEVRLPAPVGVRP